MKTVLFVSLGLVVFIGIAWGQPVTDTKTASDNVFWDVSHYDYHIEVRATSAGTCVPGICEGNTCVRRAGSEEHCLVDHICSNCSASCTGTCTIGSLGRLYGWDIESENPAAPGCDQTTVCKKGICKKSATFGAYVFYFGKLKTTTLTAEAEVNCK